MSRGGPETDLYLLRAGIKLQRQLYNGGISHVSRDVQEGVIVVLDRVFLIALVVHFKTCQFCLRSESLGIARSPVFSQLFIGYGTELKYIYVYITTSR